MEKDIGTRCLFLLCLMPITAEILIFAWLLQQQPLYNLKQKMMKRFILSLAICLPVIAGCEKSTDYELFDKYYNQLTGYSMSSVITPRHAGICRPVQFPR